MVGGWEEVRYTFFSWNLEKEKPTKHISTHCGVTVRRRKETGIATTNLLFLLHHLASRYTHQRPGSMRVYTHTHTQTQQPHTAHVTTERQEADRHTSEAWEEGRTP